MPRVTAGFKCAPDVAELKASITRQEADVAAIKRELAKLPS